MFISQNITIFYIRHIIVIVGLLIISFYSTGQNQGNVWYFGKGAGLDFNKGNPTAITNNPVSIINDTVSGLPEGTGTLSDNTGSLLMFSNGEKVFDSDLNVMPNGDSLFGHYSSTQSAFFVPKPRENDRFIYLFTTDAFENDLQNGLRYSIIDMCLNNGKGDVIKSKKNLPLMNFASEKINVAKHANGMDYWILSHKYLSNAFHAFLLTEKGIVDTVISRVGTVHDNGEDLKGAIGELKVSPDNSKIGIASSNGNNLIELYDFNNATGKVSNPIKLPRENSSFGGYGVAFSPDNSKVYFTLSGGKSSYKLKLVQFDLETGNGNPDSIKSSKFTIIEENLSSQLGLGLQLGPDGKIYKINWSNPSFLDVVSSPNKKKSNFEKKVITLKNGKGGVNLPSFITPFKDTLDLSKDNINIAPPAPPTLKRVTVQITSKKDGRIHIH